MLPRTVDVAAVTGNPVVGSPTNWQTPNGAFNIEHLATVNASNELLVLWWSPQGNWKSVNVSTKTGYRIADRAANWQTRHGPSLVEHLAARTLAGAGDSTTRFSVSGLNAARRQDIAMLLLVIEREVRNDW